MPKKSERGVESRRRRQSLAVYENSAEKLAEADGIVVILRNNPKIIVLKLAYNKFVRLESNLLIFTVAEPESFLFCSRTFYIDFCCILLLKFHVILHDTTTHDWVTELKLSPFEKPGHQVSIGNERRRHANLSRIFIGSMEDHFLWRDSGEAYQVRKEIRRNWHT